MVLSDCTSDSVPTCDPVCAPGFSCVNGSCVFGGPSDMAMGDGAPATCNPACSGATPKCNPSNHCVACLADTDCPDGHYCKVISPSISSCVPGCMSDDRCGGKKCCGNSCVDTTSDTNNCGGCAMPCNATHAEATCSASKCGLGACASGYGDCNGDPKDGCEANFHVDVANCTGCGMACAPANGIPGCSDGCYISACNFGYDDCNADITDGCETSVLTDINNCGGCSVPCKGLPNAAATCTAGNCVLGQCNVGYYNCDGNPQNGCEVAIGTDVNNCGGCGNKCANGLVCTNGGCTCAKCNFPNAASSCVNNVCVMGACVQGFADCNNNPNDGCEVNLQNDKNNCNGCGQVCGNGLYCVMGQCQMGCLMGMGPPSVCTMGVDPMDMKSKWVICQADCNGAWVSTIGGGTYYAGLICKSMGYSKVGSYGGTCGDVCSYCVANTSCMAPGMNKWDGGGLQKMDQSGPVLSFTVEWQCLP